MVDFITCVVVFEY